MIQVHFSTLKKQFLECEEWLSSLDIKERDKTRFNTIKDFVCEVAVREKEAMPQAMRDKYYQNIYDCFTYVDLHRHFRNRKLDKSLVGKIRQACRMAPITKKRGDQNRNHLFELELAHFFESSGTPVVGYEDVKLQVGINKLHIECKRIASEKMVENNVELARKKIKSELETSSCRGMIALALEEITNPNGTFGGDRNLTNTFLPTNSEEETQEKVFYFAERFKDNYPSALGWKNDGIIAIVLAFRFVAKIGEIDSKAFYPAIIPLIPKDTSYHSDWQIVNSLSPVPKTDPSL